MRVESLVMAALVLVPWCGIASAQTAVQQPSFNFTTVGTTVTAPDGGTMGLGGVLRASSGRSERGVPMLGKLPYAGRLFNNRGIGQDVSSSYMTTSPRIIILEEEEEKLGLQNYGTGAPVGGVLGSSLSRSYAQPRRELNGTDVRAIRLSQFVANNEFSQQPEPEHQTGPTPAELRRQNEAALQSRNSEAYKFFEKGRAAEDAGKANVAKIYYQMAVRRAPEELKDVVQQRLANLQSE